MPTWLALLLGYVCFSPVAAVLVVGACLLRDRRPRPVRRVGDIPVAILDPHRVRIPLHEWVLEAERDGVISPGEADASVELLERWFASPSVPDGPRDMG